jgi:arabinofuranosyltransferase
MKTRGFQIGILSLTALVAVALFYQYRWFFHDDAYISLRYVQNFLNGNGLVWNAGERVEGYSNFLLVIIVSALGRLGLDIVLAAKLIGAGSYLLLVGLVFGWSRKWSNERSDTSLWMIPVIVTATAAPIVIWSLAGLETVFFTLLSTAGVLSFATCMGDDRRPMVGAGVLFGLVALCRPDGALFGALACGYGLIWGLFTEKRFDSRIVGLVIPAALLVLPHLIWRYLYYGYWVPNTYYVKGPQSLDLLRAGISYVGDFAVAFPVVLVLTGIAAVWGVGARTLNRRSGWLLTVIVVYLVYVALIGGDHMPAYRLFVPIIPLAGVLLFQLLRTVRVLTLPWVSAGIAVLVLGMCAVHIQWPDVECRRARITDGAAFIGTLIGKYINANWPAGSVVALNTAGSTPYFAPKLRFIDMLGLNDTTIAHRKSVPIRTEMQKTPGHGKGDGRYILSRRPDYVIIGPSNGDYIADFPWFLSDRELEESEEFVRLYQPVKVIISARVPGYDQHIESSLGALRFVYYQRRR